MTEKEWSACNDPTKMLSVLWGKASERKFRLFLCDCLRHTGLRDGELMHVLCVGESMAEGLASEEDRQGTFPFIADLASGGFLPEAALVSRLTERWVDWGAAKSASFVAWKSVPYVADSSWDHESWQIARKDERVRQASLLHDIFGNPFRTITFDPVWRTDTALSLAQQMYDSRDFGSMPILADALQDAGCDNDDILNHCRDTNQIHVRGCWVIDLILGKK